MSKVFHNHTVRRTLQTAIILIMTAVIGHPAFAQDVNGRLKRLENELQTLNRAVFKGEMPPPGSLALGDEVSSNQSANIELRLQQIEMELRSLTGRVEQESFEATQFREDMTKKLEAMEQRLSAMEARGGAMATDTPAGMGQSDYEQYGQDGGGYPPYPAGTGGVGAGLQNMGSSGATLTQPGTEVPSDPESAYDGSAGHLGTLRQSAENVPEGAEVLGTTSAPMGAETPVDSYERAFTFLRDRHYDEAEVAFKSFLDRYPSHELAANAQYWLGETYYVRNSFDKAARVFAEAYQKYPDGPKGADNLLKLGMSLAGMGKKQDACLTYSQLQKEYAAGSQPILMRAENEMEKLGCQQF